MCSRALVPDVLPAVLRYCAKAAASALEIPSVLANGPVKEQMPWLPQTEKALFWRRHTEVTRRHATRESKCRNTEATVSDKRFLIEKKVPVNHCNNKMRRPSSLTDSFAPAYRIRWQGSPAPDITAHRVSASNLSTRLAKQASQQHSSPADQSGDVWPY